MVREVPAGRVGDDDLRAADGLDERFVLRGQPLVELRVTGLFPGAPAIELAIEDLVDAVLDEHHVGREVDQRLVARAGWVAPPPAPGCDGEHPVRVNATNSAAGNWARRNREVVDRDVRAVLCPESKTAAEVVADRVTDHDDLQCSRGNGRRCRWLRVVDAGGADELLRDTCFLVVAADRRGTGSRPVRDAGGRRTFLPWCRDTAFHGLAGARGCGRLG